MARVSSMPSRQARTLRSSGAKQASTSNCTRQGAARSVPSQAHSRRYWRVVPAQAQGRQGTQDGVPAAAVGQDDPAHPQGQALDLAGSQVRQVLGGADRMRTEEAWPAPGIGFVVDTGYRHAFSASRTVFHLWIDFTYPCSEAGGCGQQDRPAEPAVELYGLVATALQRETATRLFGCRD